MNFEFYFVSLMIFATVFTSSTYLTQFSTEKIYRANDLSSQNQNKLDVVSDYVECAKRIEIVPTKNCS